MKTRSHSHPLVSLAAVALALAGIAASPTAAAGTRLDVPLPFPRLGMWWPDPWAQPLADIARYDWVILDQWQPQFIAPLRAIKPNLTLLNATNACEVFYEPGNPAANTQIRTLPAQWFLTQIGTGLTAAISATVQTIPVERTTVSQNGKNLKLFVAGDTVLVEGESMQVISVNATAKTIKVKRGYIRPAAAHTAGARIAAHVSFWPNSWVMNLAAANVAPGPGGASDWAHYNAGNSLALLADPGWDGLLIDRTDRDESWLIGNSTARSLAPDQSNTVPTNYQSFDAAWNQGLTQYLGLVRAGTDPDRILFANWAMTDYGTLNGNNMEGFPTDSGGAYNEGWHRSVFGPWPSKGSYMEWLSNARAPNLTMVETYEDDAATSPSGNGTYYNRCHDAGFGPNYRKMRFGLTTALLGDGYFSYEMNTNGHGSLCLMWFDEYDNAGQGRGYLGQALAPAYRANAGATPPDLLTGARFDLANNLSHWSPWADPGYQITAARDAADVAQGDASMRLTVGSAKGDYWGAVYVYKTLALTAATEYTVSFSAKADRDRELNVWAQMSTKPWTTWLDFGAFPLSTQWQRFELPVTSTGGDPLAMLEFGVGQDTGQVWIDNVQVKPGNPDIWRRDFEHGTALVNASATAATVALNGTFRKIAGTQDPAVNDGSLVTQVVIAPHDGIVLLKP
ncbi:putative glycoside hydrolase [uncultured Thiodictyon sp.]|uniref:putative glycoside hydrolase n=1 Tax=uncultured Thiodictyon sp. TaxID=1846217 RepID=UPI0025E28C7F|nr:putative glycoside hydrolase [uncultured Thiodictyon sp.]